MDRIVGRVLRDYPDARVMLCTALSQQRWKDTTKCTFRPIRFHSFLEFARIPAEARVSPVMAEQFHLQCDSSEAAALAEERIRGLAVDGQPLMIVRRDGTNLFTGCRFTDASVLPRRIVRRDDGESRPFAELFHMIHTLRSGRHHPDGAFWVRTGRHRRVEAKVPLTDVAPTLLAQFGVRPPLSMRGRPLPV
jgi:hypothetical protein